MKAYLAGAIEKAQDLGIGWREDITPKLNEIGITAMDPCKLEVDKLKGLHLNRLPKGVNHWHELKNFPEHRSRFKRYMNRIIQWDLDIIEDCHMLIVLWDEAASKGAGTHGEMTVAKRLGIPVYTVVRSELPAWLLGCSNKTFTSFDDLLNFLRR